MKAIKCKLKNLIGSVYFFKGIARGVQLSRICLTSTKTTSNMPKVKNSFTFFVRNRCGSQQSYKEFS